VRPAASSRAPVSKRLDGGKVDDLARSFKSLGVKDQAARSSSSRREVPSDEESEEADQDDEESEDEDELDSEDERFVADESDVESGSEDLEDDGLSRRTHKQLAVVRELKREIDDMEAKIQ
jgi:hypothetical protein